MDARVTERQTSTQEGVIVLDNLKLQRYGDWPYGFFVNISIGVPPQEVIVQLTGGGITWVPDSETQCIRETLKCEIIHSYGAYNQSLSDTSRFIPIDGGFRSKTTIEGHFIYDTLLWGGIQMGGFPFLATTVFSDVPQLGLGASPRHFSYLTKDTDAYKFEGKSLGTLQAIFDARRIGVMGFAMYYDAYEVNSSQIMLGAIDTEKYEAPIVTYTQETQKEVGRFTTRRFSFSRYIGDDKTVEIDNLKTAIALGDSNIRFPDFIQNLILVAMNASQSNVGWYVNCEAAEKLDLSLDFEFDDINITLTAKDLIGRIEERTEAQEDLECRVFLDTLEYGGELLDEESADIYLGIPFLRVAYVWLDYQNNQTSLAKARQRIAISNIVKIEKGGITTTLAKQNFTSVRNGTGEGPPPGGGNGDGSSKPPVAAIAGGSVGGIVVLGAIGYLAFVFWLRKRKQPEIPLVPMGELEGRQKFELGPDHGKSELPDGGQELYRRELPADHEYPTELPG
ncbi:hypothetical protein TWF481_007459 [Arthrobotrys musiformis]|uniref:Peptidase A1 domain-containing protein n=1 Tax=Arthrobotrys musiformis TaxID=47236 RepID=A0AAV9WCJ5_9PEZI